MTSSGEPGHKSDVVTIGIPCAICGETEFTVVLKGEALHRYICPKCKTPTYVYISQKLETIMIREDELCPECRGSGKCGNCNGTGETKCSRCEGRGWIYDTKYEFYYPCPYCGGSQKSSTVWSSYEDFVGDVVSGDIKLGSGVGTCHKCMGSGVCPSCRGIRFKPRTV